MPLKTAGPAGISQRNADFKFKKAILCGFARGEYPAQAVGWAWMAADKIRKYQGIKKHPLFIQRMFHFITKQLSKTVTALYALL